MNRREFLKLGGVVSTVMLVGSQLAGSLADRFVEAQVGDLVYRGTNDGRVYLSENAGETWQIHTNFGDEFSIVEMAADPHQNLQAELGFAGYSFQLTLDPNSKIWRTA